MTRRIKPRRIAFKTPGTESEPVMVRVVSETPDPEPMPVRVVTITAEEVCRRAGFGVSQARHADAPEPEEPEEPKGWKRRSKYEQLVAKIAELEARIESLEAGRESAK